jgi:hypothetical protein
MAGPVTFPPFCLLRFALIALLIDTLDKPSFYRQVLLHHNRQVVLARKPDKARADIRAIFLPKERAARKRAFSLLEICEDGKEGAELKNEAVISRK